MTGKIINWTNKGIERTGIIIKAPKYETVPFGYHCVIEIGTGKTYIVAEVMIIKEVNTNV